MPRNSPPEVSYLGAVRLCEQAAVIFTTDLGFDANATISPQQLYNKCASVRGRVLRRSSTASDDGADIIVDLSAFKELASKKYWLSLA